MKRGDWRLWIALLAAMTFVGLVLDSGRKQSIHDRVDDSPNQRILARWLDAD